MAEQQCQNRGFTAPAIIIKNRSLLVQASLTDEVVDAAGDDLGIGPEAEFDSKFWHDHVRSQALRFSNKDYHSQERLFLQTLMSTRLDTVTRASGTAYQPQSIN